MKGDFSRNFVSDRQRGKDYRRVLLQQGRMLLDSDINALVDAQDQLVRELTADVGCRAGSPDFGFVATPGPLLAVFDSMSAVEVHGDVPVWLDYTERFGGRYPSLYLLSQLQPRIEPYVEVALRHLVRAPADGDAPRLGDDGVVAAEMIRVWLKTRGGEDVEFFHGRDRSPLDAHWHDRDGFEWRAVDIKVPGDTHIEHLGVELSSEAECWLGMIEVVQPASSPLQCWATGGRYQIEGLSGGWARDGVAPAGAYLTDEDELSRLEETKHFVAYVDLRERYLSHVEDGEIRELALGAAVDTCGRSQVDAALKLAPVLPGNDASGIDPALLAAPFAHPEFGDARLAFVEADVVETEDPCAVERVGGYSGAQNRLYRVEVHHVDSDKVVLKWSRNNASELFAVDLDEPGTSSSDDTIWVDADHGLRDGDVVEFLIDDIVAGDATLGHIELDDEDGEMRASFAPPRDRVGPLFRLEKLESQTRVAQVEFALRDPTDPSLAKALPAEAFDAESPRVRRWHGFVEAKVGGPSHSYPLEENLDITLSGQSWQVGDWWTYEARRHATSLGAGGEFEPPTGPERLYAPLVLLERTAPDDTLQVVQWLDTRQPPTCALMADDIAYDGAQHDTQADTVQEAIDELYDRQSGDCCKVVLYPNTESLADRIEALMDQEPTRRLVVCLRTTRWDETFELDRVLEVEEGRLELRGCDRTFVEVGPEGGIHVGKAATLELDDLTLYRRKESDQALVELSAHGASFTATSCALVDMSITAVVVASSDFRDELAEALVEAEPAETRCSVALVDSVLVGRRAIGLLQAAEVVATDSSIFGDTAAVSVGSVQAMSCEGTLFSSELSVASAPDVQHPARIRQWLDALLTSAPQPDESMTGTAVEVVEVEQGECRGCEFYGGICLGVGELSNAEFHANRYLGRHAAIVARRAEDCRFFDETISVSEGVGLCLAEAAWQVSVESCEMNTRRTAVQLGWMGEKVEDTVPAAVGKSEGNSFGQLALLGNRIRTNGDGIGLGTGTGKDKVFMWSARGIRLDGNDILCSPDGTDEHSEPATGIFMSTLAVASDAPASVRIFDNRVDGADVGIHVAGRGIEVCDNQIISPPAYDGVRGIHLEMARGAIIKANVVRVDEGYSVAPSPKADAAAILVQSGREVTLAQNEVLWSGQARSLVVYGPHPKLQVRDNSFSGRCQISRADDVDVAENRIGVSLTIDHCTDGHVVSNHILAQGLAGPIEEQHPSQLLIEVVRGVWKVDENRLEGQLRILPAVRTNILVPKGKGELFEKLDVDVSKTSSKSETRGNAVAIDLLLEDAQFLERGLVEASVERGADSVRRSAHRTVAPTLEIASSRVLNLIDDRSAQPVEAVKDDVAGAVSKVLEEFVREVTDIEKDPIFHLRTATERQVDLQVVANYCAALQVGHSPSLDFKTKDDPRWIAPHPESTAQVVSNHALDHISINDYRTSAVDANLTRELVDGSA